MGEGPRVTGPCSSQSSALENPRQARDYCAHMTYSWWKLLHRPDLAFFVVIIMRQISIPVFAFRWPERFAPDGLYASLIPTTEKGGNKKQKRTRVNVTAGHIYIYIIADIIYSDKIFIKPLQTRPAHLTLPQNVFTLSLNLTLFTTKIHEFSLVGKLKLVECRRCTTLLILV